MEHMASTPRRASPRADRGQVAYGRIIQSPVGRGARADLGLPRPPSSAMKRRESADDFEVQEPVYDVEKRARSAAPRPNSGSQ
eukprot:4934080-Amphidinium_carterae.2